MLTIDSYSRRHFFRKLPKTVEFLNSLKGSKYSVFDFKVHNIYSATSVENMVPVFGSNFNIDKPLNIQSQPSKDDYLGPNAL